MAFYEENPQGIGKADLVAAILSYNDADSIGVAVERVSRGLKDHFGDRNAVLINCDSHSVDGTREAFFQAPSDVPRIYLSTETGGSGKGLSLRNLFEKVRQLEAKAVLVLECAIDNLTPYWVAALAGPLFKGTAFVQPLYVRHKYEAPLTSALVYPLSRCLYGRRCRQLGSGEVAFTGAMAETFLNAPGWSDAVSSSGIDVWMGMVAMTARVPICQTVMHAPRLRRSKGQAPELAPQFRRVLTVLFDLMVAYGDFWKRVKWSKPTGLFGMNGRETEVPPTIDVKVARLHAQFLEGFAAYEETWRKIFEPATFNKLMEVRSLAPEHFTLPSQTWATMLFDGAVAYRDADAGARAALIDCFLPLYLAKVVSYVKRTERMSIQQAEDYVEAICEVFEENKRYLIDRW